VLAQKHSPYFFWQVPLQHCPSELHGLPERRQHVPFLQLPYWESPYQQHSLSALQEAPVGLQQK